MLRGGAGMIRFCLDPKNMSLQSTTFPPLTAAARSISPMAQRVPIGSHVPIHPQPCDPAVGKDVQSYVGRMNRADLQDVVRIATERGSLHGRLPRSTLEIVVRRRSRHETDVHA